MPLLKANDHTTARQNVFIRNSAAANEVLDYGVITGGSVTNAIGAIVTHANIGSSTMPITTWIERDSGFNEFAYCGTPMNPLRAVLPLLASSFLLEPCSFAQGPLNPPGAPGPTMKSLDQLDAKLDEGNAKAEKRTPISSLPFTIVEPGSYYLTSSLNNGGGGHGITVSASEVTIDLMGFTLSTSSADGSGIFADNRQAITVRNGVVTGWESGVNLGGRYHRIEKITARNNSVAGVACGFTCSVADCVAGSNGGGGIDVSGDGVIFRCVARDNIGIGIEAGNGAVVSHSTSRDNGGTGITVQGGSLVQSCAALGNTGNNITAAGGSTVARCTAEDSDAHGIVVTERCLVLENNCHLNGGGNHSGIFASGNNNRIESNFLSSNQNRGLTVAPGATGNLIIKNSASGHATSYVIPANNKVGTVHLPANSAAISGNTGGGLGTADPWANFGY